MSIILICMLYVFLSILISSFNPLSANPQIWLNTLKQFVGKLPTNCLSVFDHFVKLALKGLINPIQATLKGKLTIYFKVQCVKSVQIRSFSGPYSPIFWLNSWRIINLNWLVEELFSEEAAYQNPKVKQKPLNCLRLNVSNF